MAGLIKMLPKYSLRHICPLSRIVFKNPLTPKYSTVTINAPSGEAIYENKTIRPEQKSSSENPLQTTNKGTSAAVPVRTPVANKRALLRKPRFAEANQANASMPVVCSEEARLDIVASVCTASNYDMVRLSKYLQMAFTKLIFMDEDVIYIQISQEMENISSEAFIFENGCFVIWGRPADVSSMVNKFKDVVKPFEIDSLSESETESLGFQVKRSENFFATMRGETIILEGIDSARDQDDVLRARLAFSHGLVDSVKMAILENSLARLIEKVRPIPLTIASGGRLPLGRAEVLKVTGELLKFRADLNLHSELIDTPEMYWSEPQLEEHYQRVSKVLDIRQRAHVLNKKLDYANELASVLRSHLSEQHGLKLEWGIIVLIAVEVAFETLHWVLD